MYNNNWLHKNIAHTLYLFVKTSFTGFIKINKYSIPTYVYTFEFCFNAIRINIRMLLVFINLFFKLEYFRFLIPLSETVFTIVFLWFIFNWCSRHLRINSPSNCSMCIQQY